MTELLVLIYYAHIGISELEMNGHQGSFIAGQAWHADNRMECRACYCLSSALAGSIATQPKNPLTIQSGFIMI
ncbi:conserved protein of unknown function [Acidithiobacillus ferrivorans]|uniref:Uncharacterized protein n=1 Tax=Acidithiobacillus ferrivorans TaxID=160808 RepID=A0ABY1MLE5_9PROT|nr:conserved protein of unknown function [Acidithiobacillus ferrivorans]